MQPTESEGSPQLPRDAETPASSVIDAQQDPQQDRPCLEDALVANLGLLSMSEEGQRRPSLLGRHSQTSLGTAPMPMRPDLHKAPIPPTGVARLAALPLSEETVQCHSYPQRSLSGNLSGGDSPMSMIQQQGMQQRLAVAYQSIASPTSVQTIIATAPDTASQTLHVLPAGLQAIPGSLLATPGSVLSGVSSPSFSAGGTPSYITYQPVQAVHSAPLVQYSNSGGLSRLSNQSGYVSLSGIPPASLTDRGGKRGQRSTRPRPGGVRSSNEGGGGGGSSSTLPDVTVEDLLRLVQALQPHERAVDAVSQGLHCLDSSATAALLKELSKQGLVKRAFEIFDWLRQLPATHPLSTLCDLYTYTTMIAQCGSAAQLRKALELVAEMRARSITCNVHTYSALMNVCMKANELDVALDVFKQMQEAGLVPNLVTYNILIDVYVKKGKWDEAIGALDSIQQQGIQAEARTYNTVISACSKAGQYDRALRAYQHMEEAGVEPSTTTYTAVIGVYGRVGQLEKCLDIYHEMVQRGCERNVITYSSLISACEKAGQWQVALELYDIMRREGCRPNVVTFNSLIAACAHGDKWEKAGELFDQMTACGCKPDAVTYSVLIGTYEKCHQWQAGLAAWEMMTASGFHPDAAVYYSLLEVLWNSGVVMAQARALQLWASANRAGQLRVYTNVNSTTRALQYSMVTPKPGVAACTMLCWLLELRNKLLKDESAATLPYPVVVTLQRTRTTRNDATPSMAAHEAVRCLLLGSSSPLQVVLQPTSTLLSATSAELLHWLNSNNFAELTYLLQVASANQWSLKGMALEVNTTTSRCMDAYAAVRRLESQQGTPVSAFDLKRRPELVALVLQYSSSVGLMEEAAYDGLALFDRVMGVPGSASMTSETWSLCLMVCLVVCARHGSPPPQPGQPTLLWQTWEGVQSVTGFKAEECQAMERQIMLWLQGNLTIISPLRVLLLYQENLGFFSPVFRYADRTAGDMSALLARTAGSAAWLTNRPSLLAAGLLAALRNIKGILPVWPQALQELTGFVLEEGELPRCMSEVEALLQ